MGLSPVMSVAKDFSGIRSRRDFVADRYFHVTLQRGQTAGERPELGLVGVSPCCPSAKRRLAMQRAPPQSIFNNYQLMANLFHLICPTSQFSNKSRYYVIQKNEIHDKPSIFLFFGHHDYGCRHQSMCISPQVLTV